MEKENNISDQPTTETNNRSNSTDKGLQKRPWKSPKIIEESYRNTEQGPGMPFAPSQNEAS